MKLVLGKMVVVDQILLSIVVPRTIVFSANQHISHAAKVKRSRIFAATKEAIMLIRIMFAIRKEVAKMAYVVEIPTDQVSLFVSTVMHAQRLRP